MWGFGGRGQVPPALRRAGFNLANGAKAMVREEGVEPSCLAALASETSASAIPPPPRN